MRSDAPKGPLADGGLSVHPGDVLGGKYRLERLLGEGGMGIVFVGLHVALDERVAIKVLHPKRASDPQILTRFLREAKTGFKLRSEHVVRTLDVDVHSTPGGDLPYIVMELLDGQELGRRIDTSGAVPQAEAIDLVLQACEALASAHALGVVHRDLKPSNLFLVDGPDGKPFLKVLDFGISKVNGVADAEHATTTTGAVLGSPGYMPPEQLRASRDVDARSDIWSLAMVLWEMLVGSPMFAMDTFPEICAKVLHGNLPTLREAGATIPEGLEAVIARALAAEPAIRHPTVLAFAEALAPFLETDATPRLLRIANLSRPPAERGSSIPPAAELSTASTATSHPPPAFSSRSITATPVPWGLTEPDPQASPPQEARRRGRGVWIAVGLGAVAGGALTIATLGRTGPTEGAGSPAVVPTSSVEPTPSSPPAPAVPASVASPPPSSSASSAAPPPASATPTPAPRPSASAAPRKEHPRVRPSPSATAAPPPASSASSGTRPANGAPILR